MRHLLFIISMLLVFIIYSCGDQKQGNDQTDVSHLKKTDKITVENIWTRVGAEKGNSAMYFDIVNNTLAADTLISASSDVAELVEIHETYKRDNDRMGMRQVSGVPIPAGATASLKPMGHHVMFIKLRRDLKIGDTLEAVLLFAKSGEFKINSTIKDMNMQN